MGGMTGDQGTSIREDVVVLLAKASGSALRTANAALEPFGFRARHYATVKIAAEGGGVPQRQIGAVLGLDPSAVVALVDDLESLGLVQRQPDPDDRRTRLVSPTAAGLAMLEKVSPVVGRVQERSMGGLTAAERDTFLRLLRRVVKD